MARSEKTEGTIFVASDSSSIADLVGKMLTEEFTRVRVSTDPDQWAADFDRSAAEVILLAFENLERTVRSYKLLYRHSRTLRQLEHRILTLCHKDEVNQAYTLCRQRTFDNYVVFWPLAFDPPRLKMTVHQALHELANSRCAQQQTLAPVTQDSQLDKLQHQLQAQLGESRNHIERVAQTVEQTEQAVYGAIGDTYRQLNQRIEAVDEQSQVPLDGKAIQAQFGMVSEAMQHIRDWSKLLVQLNERQQALTNSLIKPSAAATTILVVEDDEFQRSVMRRILGAEHYRLAFAASGDEALELLRRSVPDLILMDVMLPGMDGIEATRRIKANPMLRPVPVVMITSHNQREVVVECLKAGAADFVVKPYNRATLTAKVTAVLEAGRQDGGDRSGV